MSKINYVIGKNIEHFRKLRKLQKQDLADAIDKPSSAISRYISGQTNIKPEVLFQLASILEVSIQDLFTGAEYLDEFDGVRELKPSYALNTKGAPVYDKPVTAGSNHQDMDCSEEDIIGYINIKGSRAIAYFPVSGPSMQPIINPGEYIGIENVDDIKKVDQESIYMIITEDSRMIKYLTYDEVDNPDAVICTSPNHPEFKIYIENIKAVYRVCATHRDFRRA